MEYKKVNGDNFDLLIGKSIVKVEEDYIKDEYGNYADGYMLTCKDGTIIDIPKDVEVYVVDDDSEAEVTLDGKQETVEVESIPVEWIVNWLNKSNRHYCDVDLMLEDWREENA